MQMQTPGAMSAPAGNSFGHAQSALKGAGGMMTAMKWGFVAIGGLCVLGGVPQIAIPRAQPGAQVQVRVSPQNQHEIALVF
jgi:hypothetical protein